MRQSSSDDARRNFRKLLNDVEHGECVEIQRYGLVAAVVVPPDWFRRARNAVGEPVPEFVPVPEKKTKEKK